MRKVSHWSPAYVIARTKEIIWHRSAPEAPWLTKDAVSILTSYLRESDVGLETGSGRSTRWFGRRVGHLTSIEDNREWFATVKKQLEGDSLTNVDLYLHESVNASDRDQPYVRAIDSLPDESLDFALIDGAWRDRCTLSALPKIKPGGVLIIDNVNWYLPSQSLSPNSRSHREGPNGSSWREVAVEIEDWRRIWTSSGVTDTALFFKPLM